MVAYLIMGHKDPGQILHLIETLRDSAAFFVIHIDGRAGDDVFKPLRDYAATHPEVLLTRRIRCYWGAFGIANAMTECVKARAVWAPLRLRDSFIGPGLSHQKRCSNRRFPDREQRSGVHRVISTLQAESLDQSQWLLSGHEAGKVLDILHSQPKVLSSHPPQISLRMGTLRRVTVVGAFP